VRGLGVAVTLLVLACSHRVEAPVPAAADQVEVMRWGVIGSTGEFFVRQRLQFQVGGESGSFDAALQVTCGTLTVVGLTPLGTPLFSIRQQGSRIEVDADSTMRWPFPPERLLLDVHRAFLYPMPVPAPADGIHVYDFQGVSVREAWQAGRLQERTISAPSRGRPGLIHVLYEGGWIPGDLPERTWLKNGTDGYSLSIQSSDLRPLPCHGEGAVGTSPDNGKRGVP